MRQQFTRTLMLSLAALAIGLLVVPVATLALTPPQAAFAQGDDDQSPVAVADSTPTSGSATAAPEPQSSVTPSASATATAPPSPDPATPRAEEPVATATPGSGSGPTIASDLADYAPGGTVTLTGAGWQAGEAVTIVVNDTGDLSWSLTRIVVADADGRVILTFELPTYYVPDYDVTATGSVSGVATTKFTDAATGTWRWWMTAPTPANTDVVNPGGTIRYVLNAQKTTTSTTGFNDAVMTLTLAGNAVFTGPTGALGANLGSISGIGTNTLRWSGMNLSRTAGTNDTRTITVTATVPASTSAGSLTATATDANDTNGSFYNGSTSRLETTTHSVAGPCDFADEGSGTYASSICWFDLSGYNAAAAASASGQTMRQILRGGYSLTYTIKVGSTDAAAAAKGFPTWDGSYLGNPNSGVGGYQGIDGMPAIYQTANGGTTTLELSNIRLTHSSDGSGPQVFGYALVGADAESTDDRESITWSTSAPATFTSIGRLGNACGGGFTGDGTRTVTCSGGVNVGAKDGTPILYTKDPTTFTQKMVGSGLQGVGFGVMVSGVQLIKNVVNPVKTTDGFDISVASGGTTLITKTANAASGWSADTKQVYWIIAGAVQDFTMTESPTGSTDPANYAVSWACTNNGDYYPPIGSSDTSKTVKLTAFSDFIVCTITNTGPALTLRKSVDNTAGGALAPANWTLSATKSGSAPAISGAPSLSSTTTGKVTTASTATVAVPVGTYTLGESSTATGADRYAASAWSCTKAGSGTSTPNAVLAAGDNVTCTITNTYVPAVTVRKTWVGGANGDKTDLVINNATTSPGMATSTSNGVAGSWADPVTVARATPVVGSTVFIADNMRAANRATYTPVASCRDGINAVVAVSGGAFTMPNSDVTCEYTNTVIVGSVTWSKVDAGSTATLLKGSEWTLTGPSYPAPGSTVSDCVGASAADCTGVDKDPVAGSFSVGSLWCGAYTLVEKTAPIGFQLGNPKPFTIKDALPFSFGPITNTRIPVPSLPLTGGPSADSYFALGVALLLLGTLAAWLQRRRRISHPET